MSSVRSALCYAFHIKNSFTEKEADCILSAPHRTFREKLERLRGLKTEAGDVKYLEKCIEFGEYIERRLDCGRRIFHELYEADVFHHGRKEEIQERKIFCCPSASSCADVRESFRKMRAGCMNWEAW